MVDDETILRQLDPIYLLLNMYCGLNGALKYHSIPHREMYRRFGEDIVNAKCANCDREIHTWFWVPSIEGHPDSERKRARLASEGVETRWGTYTDPGMEARVLSVDVRRETIEIVRAMAKADAGVTTRDQSTAFDRKFNLYFNQNYPPDWKEWQASAPLETWP